MFFYAARFTSAILLIELVNFARARSAAGAWMPDPAIAMIAALAMGGKVNIIIPSALILAILRAPATLAEPFSSVAALVAFAWFVRSTRRFMTQERPPIIFIISALGGVFVQWVAWAAASSRGKPYHFSFEGLACAVTTGFLAMVMVPSLRKIPWTRELFERKFGE
ncbi:MAG: hypothetical protein ACKVS6_10530 [Planctomycetota bacterium]